LISITLCYAIDGTSIANLISEEFKDPKSSWKFIHYPLIGKNDNSEFWTSLSNGTLKTDIVLFICTDDFHENNHKDFGKLRNISDHTKYRFSWIIVGKRKQRPETIPYDVEIVINDGSKCNSESNDDKHFLLSQVANYLQLVDIAVKRQKELKEERRKRKQKLYNLLLPLCVAYFGIIICAISVMQWGQSHQFKSSAELLLITTGFITIASVLSSFGFILSTRRKRMQEKESDDFDRELSMSLSSSASKTTKAEEIIDVASEIIGATSSPTSNALDLIFTINKMRVIAPDESTTDSTTFQERETSRRKITSSEDIEITKAIGDDTYLPLGHLKFNWKQMKGYYDISKRQAKTSFAWAIAISFIGILLIVFAILSPLIPNFRSENSLIPIVGSIGGAVVELFAGTILIVYIKSLSQMNLYHKALSGYQRYLSCINLVSKISSLEKQDQLYEDIIREEIKKMDVTDDTELSIPKKIKQN